MVLKLPTFMPSDLLNLQDSLDFAQKSADDIFKFTSDSQLAHLPDLFARSVSDRFSDFGSAIGSTPAAAAPTDEPMPSVSTMPPPVSSLGTTGPSAAPASTLPQPVEMPRSITTAEIEARDRPPALPASYGDNADVGTSGAAPPIARGAPAATTTASGGGQQPVAPDEPVTRETVTRSAAVALERAGLPTTMAPYIAGIAINEGILQPGTIARDHWSVGGVKAGGTAGTVTVPTREVVNGQSVTQTASFGKFNTMQEGMDALAAFVRDSPRFGPVVQQAAKDGDYAGMIEGMRRQGYATDPDWTGKVVTIARGLPVPSAAPSATQRASEARAQSGETGGLDTQGIVTAYKGTPYTYGGPGGRTAGFGAPSDCSGFVSAVFKNQYNLDLVPHTDGAYNQLRKLGAAEVSAQDARPGDVVFYMGAGTGGAIAHHMGVYAGGGKVLDDSVSGTNGVAVRDVGHAGQYVILRDPRVNQQAPRTAAAPPPIQPSGVAEQTGGQRVSDATLATIAPAAQAPEPPAPAPNAAVPPPTAAGAPPPVAAAPPAAGGAPDDGLMLRQPLGASTPVRDAWASDPNAAAPSPAAATPVAPAVAAPPTAGAPFLPGDGGTAPEPPGARPYDPDQGPREAPPPIPRSQVIPDESGPLPAPIVVLPSHIDPFGISQRAADQQAREAARAATPAIPSPQNAADLELNPTQGPPAPTAAAPLDFGNAGQQAARSLTPTVGPAASANDYAMEASGQARPPVVDLGNGRGVLGEIETYGIGAGARAEEERQRLREEAQRFEGINPASVQAITHEGIAKSAAENYPSWARANPEKAARLDELTAEYQGLVAGASGTMGGGGMARDAIDAVKSMRAAGLGDDLLLAAERRIAEGTSMTLAEVQRLTRGVEGVGTGAEHARAPEPPGDPWQAASARLDDVAPRLDAAEQAVRDAERAGNQQAIREADRAYGAVRAEYDRAVDDVAEARQVRAAQSAQIERAGYGRPMEQADTLPTELDANAPGYAPGAERPRTVDDVPRAGSISLNATPGASPAIPSGPGVMARGGALDVASRQIGSAIGTGGLGALTGYSQPADTQEERVRNATTGALVGAGLGLGLHNVSRLARAAGGVHATAGFSSGEAPRPRVVGRTTEAFGVNPENRYRMRFRVADLGDLVASHTDRLTPNPDFPAELQPRLRERSGSALQVDRIAKGLQPDALLTDVQQIDRGPMIVGPDNVVESGNGRVLALRRAATQYPERYQAYVSELKSRLPEYGINPADVRGIENPVLVRERLTDVNRPSFAAEANQSAVLALSPYEQALQDARNLPPEAVARLEVPTTASLDQAVIAPANRDFVRAFMATLPGNEQAALIDANGSLNAQGLQRIKAALFASTYGSESGQRLTRAFFESLDPTVKNAEGALYASLPDMARVEGQVASGRLDPTYSLAGDVSAAVDAYARLRAADMSVGDYLAQGTLFGNRETTPLQDELLRFMDENRRSRGPLRDLLKRYAEGVEALPPEEQTGMFGAVERPSKGEILDRALADVRASTPAEPAGGGLFAGTEAANPQGGAPAYPDVGPSPAGGEELARPSGPREPPPEPGRPESAPPRSLTPPEDIIPRTGGSGGTLAGEGAPPPKAGPLPEGDIVPPSLNTPQLRRALSGAERRAATMAERGLTTPSAWDWLKQAGYAGIYGPATFMNSVAGGAQELLLGQPKEAIRALTSGRPASYGAQVRAQVRAMPDGLAGLGRVLIGADPASTAAVSGGSQGTAYLSERVVNPVGHAVARFLERPGELLTEAPDAVFRPVFMAQGMAREAQQVASEMGMRGAKAASYADALVQTATDLRANPAMPLTSDEARRILAAGEEYADKLGYKGKPGAVGQWLGSISKRDDAAGVLASFLVPFPSMAARMTTAGLQSTPGIGLLPAVRRGQKTAFDVAYDQAFGTLVASGLAYWAYQGGITGSGPDDKEKRDEMISQGWQPNSTLVAGHYIPNRVFQRFQPMFDAAGEIHDALAYGKADQKPKDLVADLAKRGSRIATDQIGLSGLADLHDMLTQGFSSQIPGWAARSAARYVPYAGVLRAAANSLDPLQRKPSKWGDEAIPTTPIVQNLEMAVPGLRQNLTPAQDVLGRDAPNPQQGLGAIIPRTTTARADPVIQLFQDAGVDIPSPRTSVTYLETPLELSEDERRAWNRARGEAISRTMQPLIDNGSLAVLPAARRTERLQGLLERAAEAADRAVLGAMTPAERAQRRRAAMQRQAKAN